jgi:hypothetical protein
MVVRRLPFRVKNLVSFGPGQTRPSCWHLCNRTSCRLTWSVHHTWRATSCRNAVFPLHSWPYLVSYGSSMWRKYWTECCQEFLLGQARQHFNKASLPSSSCRSIFVSSAVSFASSGIPGLIMKVALSNSPFADSRARIRREQMSRPVAAKRYRRQTRICSLKQISSIRLSLQFNKESWAGTGSRAV